MVEHDKNGVVSKCVVRFHIAEHQVMHLHDVAYASSTTYALGVHGKVHLSL